MIREALTGLNLVLCAAPGLGVTAPAALAEAPFIVSENERICRVALPAGRVEEAQILIESARGKNPGAVLILEPTGKLEVGPVPLELGSRTVLRLSPDAGVSALPACTAPALVTIEDAESVAIVSGGPGRALIHGGGQEVVGIRVEKGRRIVLDGLWVSRCGIAGIDYQGVDPEAVSEAGTIARCHFEENGDGLRVGRTAGFICQDNTFTGQSGMALTITSKSSIVAGNVFSGNTASIRCGSDGSVIARNVIDDGLVLEFLADSHGNLFSENRGLNAGCSLTLGGSSQQLFRNRFDRASVETRGMGEMFLVANEGLRVGAAPNLKQFNPPTVARPHTEPVIVPGMGRFDVRVSGGDPKQGEPPLDVAEVGRALQLARARHPEDVIVLHLDGEFVSRSSRGLELLPHTCLILNGRIRADLGIPPEPPWERGVPLTQVVRLPETGTCSLSGGVVDAGRQAFFPINADTGGVALIEGMNLTSGAREGIHTKGRDPAAPLFVYGCNVYGNRGRGIWSHVAGRVHVIANVCIGNHRDGIDVDAEATECTVLFNRCSGNGRHGVFVEEAVTETIVFGNTLTGNRSAGVHVWNEAVKGNTGGNVIASNECRANRRGVSVGGRAEDKTAHGNFFFNNTCRENWLDGIWAGNMFATNNYFSQCVVGENRGKGFLNPGAARVFNPSGFADPARTARGCFG